MNIMTKQGQVDNVVTYEHVCDTKADLANIDPIYSTLGSIAIVLEGESGGLEIYITNSEGEWLPLNISAGGSGEGGSSNIDLSNYLLKTDIAAWAKAAEKPTYTASEVGALSSSTIIPTVPSNVSAFTNDAGYLTSHQDISGKANSTDLAAVALSGSYNDLSSKPDLSGYAPINSPDFTNDISLNRKSNSTVGTNSVAVGYDTIASGYDSFAEGRDTTASGRRSHAEGQDTIASEDQAHAEGLETTASGLRSHAEGYHTVASGWSSHAEGEYTTASCRSTHAEGAYTSAESECTHAQGYHTVARSNGNTALGKWNVEPPRYPAWTANTSYNEGDYVSIVDNENNYEVGYKCVTANNDAEFTDGNWLTLPESGPCAIVVGNGEDSQHKSNAMYMDWDGNVKLAGNAYVGATSSSTGGNKLATEAYVDNACGPMFITGEWATPEVEEGEDPEASYIQTNGDADEVLTAYLAGRTIILRIEAEVDQETYKIYMTMVGYSYEGVGHEYFRFGPTFEFIRDENNKLTQYSQGGQK